VNFNLKEETIKSQNMPTNVEKMEVGERIAYCRSSLSLTRKELIERWGMASVPTLSRWELGTVSVPSKKLPHLAEFFRKEGLIVGDEWLVAGAGAPPQRIGSSFNPDKDFDGAAQEEFLAINQKTGNFSFGRVSTNHMSPFVNYGDYVGGVNVLENNTNEIGLGDFVFVSYENRIDVGLYGVFEDYVLLKNYIGKEISISRCNISSLGKVLWINRRP